MITRRFFSSGLLSAAGCAGALGQSRLACAETAAPFLARPAIGKVKPRSGLEIEASPLGVGFETLDRKMFLPERTFDALAKLGVKWARVQTGWCRCETVKGTYDFAWLDEVVDGLNKIGVRPWFNVGYGNKLYTPDAPETTAVGWIPENSDEARQAWLAFVRELARHYRGRVSHFELWNEPNVMPFWRPGKPTPEGYVAFIRRTAETIRVESPGCVVIGGAFCGFPTDFFKASLERGLAQHVDRITCHPYALIPEKGYAPVIQTWRELLAAANPQVALWQGECGCPSTATSTGALSEYPWTESRQARWLLRRVINDLRLKFELVSWYHACDQVGYRLVGYPKGKSGAYYGLMRMGDYTLKPSYYAYQTLCALFDARTQVSDVATLTFSASDLKIGKASQIEHAVFARKGAPVCAYWLPLNVMNDTPAQRVEVTVTLKEGAPLNAPVLVDPLSGSVFKAEGAREGGKWVFAGLPLTDYPLLITDEGAIEIERTCGHQ